MHRRRPAANRRPLTNQQSPSREQPAVGDQ
jgi:hypothetical protein